MGDDALDALLHGKSNNRSGGRRSRVPGLKVADILTMPPEKQSLVNWLMRHQEAAPQTIADYFKRDIDQVQNSLEDLVSQGFLITFQKKGDTYYRVKLAPKSGRQMPKDVWQVLDNNTRQANVFISYSRRNKEFVQKLYSALEATGREVWVDWENIPVAVDWWQEIQVGIELADTFVFVLSPDSVASKVCRQEIDAAVKHNKRLVPVVWQDVEPNQVHPELSRLNWIFLRSQDNFEKGFKGLLAALDQDLDYVRTHTRLLVRALEWDRHGRDASYLLRGTDLERANHYLAQGKDQEPRPSALHHQYVLASVEVEATVRDAELEHQKQILAGQRRWLQLITAASILAGALGLASWGLSHQAQQAQLRAEQAQLKALTQSSKALFLSNQRFEALIAATRAGRLFQALDPEEQTPDLRAQVTSSLQQALFWVHEKNRLEGHTGTVWQVVFGPDGQKLASASADGTIRVWHPDGQELAVLECNGGPLLDLDFTPDGEHIAAVDAEGTLYFWSSDGQQQQEWRAHTEPTRAVDFSPDGQLIATASEDATVKLWQRDGTLVRTLRGNLRGMQALVWTQDNQIVAGDERGTIYIWDESGEQIQTFQEHRAAVTALDVSRGGKLLASVGFDRKVKLYDLTTGEVMKTTGESVNSLWAQDEPIDAHDGPIYNVHFTPDGEQLVTVGDDKRIHVWRVKDGTSAGTLLGHTGLVAALAIAPGGNIIATSGGDRAVRLWDLDQEHLHILPAHEGPVHAVAIAPNRELIASGGVDTARVREDICRQLQLNQP
ncbi:MAG: TIR domain-containing protein, partial [Cyanobacteria bacterium J06639_14]